MVFLTLVDTSISLQFYPIQTTNYNSVKAKIKQNNESKIYRKIIRKNDNYLNNYKKKSK